MNSLLQWLVQQIVIWTRQVTTLLFPVFSGVFLFFLRNQLPRDVLKFVDKYGANIDFVYMEEKKDTISNFLFVNITVRKSFEKALLLVGILYKEFTTDN